MWLLNNLVLDVTAAHWKAWNFLFYSLFSWTPMLQLVLVWQKPGYKLKHIISPDRCVLTSASHSLNCALLVHNEIDEGKQCSYSHSYSAS